jgi:PAS domain-containing protein
MPMKASDGAPRDTLRAGQFRRRPLRRLAAGQRAQRRTSASADGAYEAMMQAYVRTARELREEREASRRQEALNVAVIESPHDASVSIDAEGTITAWNARAEELFGWPAPIAIGRPLARTIIPPATRARQRGLERLLTTGEDQILNRRTSCARR